MRSAFRIVAGVSGAVVIALSLPFTILSFTRDADAVHRLHNLAGVLGFGVLLGGSLIACSRTPEGAIGPFWVAVAVGITTTLAGIVSGDFVSGVYYTAPIALVILSVLHPSRRALVEIDGVEAPAAVLATLALVPAVSFALAQAELQREGVASDPHVDFHHYSGMASYALALPGAAFAAALRVPGRRTAAWIVGVVGAGFGLVSLFLSDYAGAFATTWAWLAVGWGVAFLGLTWLGARGQAEVAA